MIKNLIIYRDSYDIESVLPFSEEINGIDLDGIIGFTRVNLKCDKNSDYLSMADSYVIGIPYKYYNIDKPYYMGVRLKNDILNNGKQVSEREANCYFDMLTGDVYYKTHNTHVVSSQNELLGILKQFIEEKKQVISEPQRPISRVRR